MRKTRRIVSAITILPTLALLCWSFVYVSRMSREFERRIPALLATAVEQRVNGKVKLGTAEIHARGVVINGATLYDGDKQVVHVKRIKIEFNLSDIVMGRIDPSKSIRRMEFVQPEILLERYADGKWSYTQIIRREPGGKPKFDGKVLITSALILLVDHLPNPAMPMRNRLSNVSGVLDYAQVKNVTFHIWGEGQPDRINQFEIEGGYGLETNVIDAAAQISDGRASYLAKYPFRVGLNITGGRADGTVSIHRTPRDARIQYSASLRLSDGTLRFKELKHPITDLVGGVVISENLVSVDLHGRLQSTPFTVRGTVADFKHPKMALAAESNVVNLREALAITGYKGSPKQFALPGTGRLKAVVSGPTNKYRVTFDAAVSTMKWAGVSARSLTAQGSYTGGVFTVNRAHANALGGSFDGSGSIRIGKRPGTVVRGRATGVNLRAVPGLAGSGVKGSASGDFTASVGSAGTNITFVGATSTLYYREITIEEPKLNLSYINGRIVVNEASARTMGGMVAVSGLVAKNGALDLRVFGSNINLSTAAALTGTASVVGHGEFDGRVTGMASDPSFAGTVGTDNLMISGVGVGRVEGIVRASKREIVTEGLKTEQCPGSLTLSGQIQLAGKTPSANLTLTAEDFELGSMLEYGGRFIPQDGKFSGEITMAGTLSTPTVLANMQIAGGTLGGVDLEDTDLKFTYDSRGYEIQDITTKFGGSAFTISGTVATSGELDLSLNSDHLALGDLSGVLGKYAKLTGEAVVVGKLGGTVDEISADLSVESSALTVNGQRFSHLGIKSALRNGVLTVSDASLTSAASKYAISALTYDGKQNLVALSLSVENGRIEHLVKALRGSPGTGATQSKQFLDRFPQPISGRLDANVDGTLLLKNGSVIPDLRVGVSLNDMKFGENSFKSVALSGMWKDDVGLIEKLQASDGEMLITASGSVGPEEALDVQVIGKNVDMATVGKWVGLPVNFSGKSDVTLIAGGTTRTPTAEMNLDIADPAMGANRFDRLTTKLVLTRTERTGDDGQSVKEDKISISDLTLRSGEQVLKVTGYIPVDLHTLALKRDVPLLVESDLDSHSLAILSKFSGLNMETGTNGSFSGNIKLSGTAAVPTLEGSLDWSKGRIGIPRLNSPMEDITAHLTLTGDKITISQLSGSSAEGGTFNIAGEVSFAGWNPNLNLAVKTENLKISGRNFSNTYGEDVRMKVQSDIKIADNWRTPSVTGTADISEGSVALPRKPLKKQPNTEPFPLNPRFDINVRVGQDVRFAAARLKMVLTGYVNVMGTLSKPSVDSSMEIVSGSMIFPTRRFKIMPGGMMTIHMPSQQSSVYVDMSAQSRVTMMSAVGRPRRYTVTMSVQGPMDRMNPEFTSSPPGLTDQQMMGMMAGQTEIESLLANNSGSDFGQNLGSIFSSAVLPSVFEPLQESLANSLGLSELSLEMGYQEPLMLTVGQHLSGNFYLDYSAALGARPDYADRSYRLRLSYRWKPGLEFGLETDETSALTFGVEGKLRF